MSVEKMPSERSLKGRTIIGFDPGAHREGEGVFERTMHEPRIYLDDGTFLAFSVEEHPSGADYGVFIIRGRADRKR